MSIYELSDSTILMLDKISMITFNKFECLIFILSSDTPVRAKISDGQKLVEYIKSL